MKNNLVAIALGFAVVGAAACGGGGGQGPQPLNQDASVTLKVVNGVCSKPDPVNAVQGHKGDKVSWTIANTCAEGVFVTLRDFAAATPGSVDNYPLDSYEAVWIDAGQTLKLQGHLKNQGTKGTYHFNFYLDERKQSGDPDIVIDN